MNTLANKRIITVATTGAWPKKADNPNLPLQPPEIVEEIYECWKLGASVAHVHVRDQQGNDSMDVGIFRQVVDGLKEQHPDCDIILNLTAAGGIGNSEEARMAPFTELKPEMASFDAGTMNWMYMGVFDNNPAFLEKLGLQMQKVDVKPEIEVFHTGMIYDAQYYIKKGILKTPAHFQFCMGCPGGIAATAENLYFMRHVLNQTVPGATWSAFGIGRGAMEILYTAVAAGGHVRVGMEDTVLYQKGVPVENNMQLVARARRVIEEYGSQVASPDEARAILGLKQRA